MQIRGLSRGQKIERIAIALLFIGSLTLRIPMLPVMGGDFDSYEEYVEQVLVGKNPYEATQESFQKPGLEHGYGYPPLWLYLIIISYQAASLADFLDFVVLMKIPVLIFDLWLGALILLALRKRASRFIAVAGAAIWLFNPHNVVTGSFTHFDPIPSFCVLAALYSMERSERRASVALALGTVAKMYPVLLLPHFLRTSGDRKRFFLRFAAILFFLSLPFLVWNHTAYLYTIFVAHFARGYGGISLLGELNRTFGFSLPSYCGLLVMAGLYLFLVCRKKPMDGYAFTSLLLGAFLVFSPVGHKTYPLWFIPPYLVWAGGFSYRRARRSGAVFLLLAGVVYFLYSWYLSLDWTRAL